MIQLAADLSDPLLELLREDGSVVDAVEVGPWFSLQRVRGYRQELPKLPFYFHGGDQITNYGIIPFTFAHISAYLHCTGSPWVSMHLTLWLPGMNQFMRRYGWRLPLPDPRRATRRFIRQATRLSRSLPVPLLLENLEGLPFAGCEFEALPERISEVLEQTGCGFLLDIGHARVAAATLGMDVRDYLGRLPLECVVQIHVSGPRERNGRLVDVHEPLQEVDYDLLGYVLARTQPQVVTLEYIRERDALREQLLRLRGMASTS